MSHATLPLGFRIELCKIFHQTKALVGDNQLHTLQAALLQLTQKTRPARLVFLGGLRLPPGSPDSRSVPRRWLQAPRRSSLRRPSFASATGHPGIHTETPLPAAVRATR